MSVDTIVFVCVNPACPMHMIDVDVPCETELGFTSLDERKLVCECAGELRDRDELAIEAVSLRARELAVAA